MSIHFHTRDSNTKMKSLSMTVQLKVGEFCTEECVYIFESAKIISTHYHPDLRSRTTVLRSSKQNLEKLQISFLAKVRVWGKEE